MNTKIDVSLHAVSFEDETGRVAFDTECGSGKLWFIIYVNSARLDPPSQDNSRIAHAVSMISVFAKDRGLEIKESMDPCMSPERRERLMEIAAQRSQRSGATILEAGPRSQRSNSSGLRNALQQLFAKIFRS